MARSGFGGSSKRLSAQEIRDSLLSLPEEERKFVVTDPVSGEAKVFSLARDSVTGKIVLNCKTEAES